MCRCGSQEQVPEVPGSSGACWCRFRRQVPEGSGEFRYKMVSVPEASSERFRKIWRVPVYTGVGSGGKFRKVLEGSGKFRRVPVCAGVGRRVPEGSRELRCVLV